ncbi:putative phosphoesterase [Melanomma pulvis-pyrius CBS 109.77]|uniref:Putative phosphoesterase n=1 Tax=Melanomma pulvis-pyrius CBS 109.77 TaxID=1314802 RepID=A0A6A6X2N6_9PLEO|nr:putative phosphoesterase [Melanomma pulvis-pyrius CBS 109.77]
MATFSTPTLPPQTKNLFYPSPPTAFERFKWNPTLFLTQYLYTLSQSNVAPALPSSKYPPIKIVSISDTHTTIPEKIPPGDILLHAGDLTDSGTFEELQAQLRWLNTLPHKHKLAIAGNHDLLLDTDFLDRSPARISDLQGSAADLDWGSVIYLNNSSVALNVHGRAITVFGSPLTPQYGNWAFQYPRIRDVWTGAVPLETDILLTHGPPKGHLDLNAKGCRWLSREVWRVKPRVCVFGHIHEGRGREDVRWDVMQRVHDGVLRGERGLGSVVGMAVVLLWRVVCGLVSGRRRRVGRATLINAAIGGKYGTGALLSQSRVCH